MAVSAGNRLLIAAVLSLCVICSMSAATAVQRPVHTYSIVARDSLTGEIGVAVQSHWFSVGSVVPWAEAGVGAVATQSLAEISYGPLGLELMRAGKNADQVLRALLEADEHPEWRQVAVIDASGRVAVHTGEKCIAEAGHRAGAQYSVQANLMENSTVWQAMARAYESAHGDLAERMLQALEAAQQEGGDIRGKQSAAMLIVKPVSSGAPYRDTVIDLRIEDHPEPVKELRRLAALNKAYNLMNKGDELVAAGNISGAREADSGALALAPDGVELKFWAAVTMFTEGNEAEALAYFKDVFTADEKWVEVVRRLPAAGLLPVDEKQIEKICSVAP
ncbi:MAG: DUF1028 domain-containing protein [Chitinivibrionia bacterium]|nr:DUF1028 domain-containing protein [Chitinivibrionia bacterium]